MNKAFGAGCGLEDERTRRRRPRRRLTLDSIMIVVNGPRSLICGMALVAIGIMIIAPGTASAATGQQKLNQTISNIQSFMVGIGIALAGIMLVLAGTKWMSTKGNPEEHTKVKAWLMDIAIGCVLVLSSSVLVEVAKGLIVQ
jgi:hypothetical protein